MELRDRLNQIFCEVFDDDNISITPEMTANDIDGWDSLSHVNLIVAIENRFNSRFSQKELLTLKNVGDLLANIRGKVTCTEMIFT
jgi:acyl carrier protein